MKKFLAILLALVMVLSLAACGGNDDTDSAYVDETYGTIGFPYTVEAVFIDDAHRTGLPGMHQGFTFSDPDWNRQEYPLSDRSDVQGKKYRRKKK